MYSQIDTVITCFVHKPPREFNLAEWSQLESAAGGCIWDEDDLHQDAMHFECRNCQCGNTLYLPLEPIDLMEELEVMI